MGRGRKVRFDQRMSDQRETREVNSERKIAERDRRDKRMLAKVESGSLPYPPHVMSWLSRKLDKPASRLTDEDIRSLRA